ncbi:NACHT domain-containing protein [Pseudomonas sp. IT-P4]|uniref:NACHT domain-containing protein n=1 Tax=Pseudomonas sp. IT-P4 TaxID=3026446 RepID=UPI0039E1BC97
MYLGPAPSVEHQTLALLGGQFRRSATDTGAGTGDDGEFSCDGYAATSSTSACGLTYTEFFWLKKQAMEKELPFIPRTLVHQHGRHGPLRDSELDPHQAPIVVLGEAGMGKSRLLAQLATQPGWHIVRADEIDLVDNPASAVMLIDALDETTAADVDSTLKAVLQELKRSSRPPFIMSCRASDWSHTKHARWIQAAYGQEPTVLRLQPLGDECIKALLRAYLPSEQVITLQSHLERVGLTHWLGNPHTLKLIAESTAHGKLPHSRSELFRHAVEQLVSEHNDLKTKNAFAINDAFELAGAVCAALLLTGHTAISRQSQPARSTDVSIIALKRLPNADRVEDLLGTRLFRALDANRFECIHRSIAEYLAAHWLVHEPLPRRSQRRLLAMFHQHGIVPSGLRGMHAWLCMSPKLAQRVICMDPAGVIENADLAGLDPGSITLLLNRLEECYSSNPMALSWWRPSAAVELASRGLLGKLVDIGTDRSKPVHLRLLVLESLEASAKLEPFKKRLLAVMLDSTDVYGARRAAVQALLTLLSGDESLECIRVMHACADPDSVRLAFDLSCLVDFVGVENELLAGLIIGCSDQNDRFGELWDKFALLKSDFPASRRTPLLNCLIDQAPVGLSCTEFYTRQVDEFRELLTALTLAAMTDNTLSPAQAWRAFSFLCSIPLYPMLDPTITERLAADHAFRRAVQQHVLFDRTNGESLDQRHERLQEIGLDCSENDAIEMLTRLDADDLEDERWKALVSLMHHDNEHGVQIRAAALRFAGSHPQRLAWAGNIELDFSRQANWERQRSENQTRAEQDRHDAVARLNEHKAAMASISKGDHQYLMIPAQAYLRVSRHSLDAGAGNGAVVQWAGDELAAAVFQGFENYLQNIQTRLSVEAISQYFARFSRYERNDQEVALAELSAEIILAAAIEHVRTRKSLECLTTEALFAIFLSLKHLPFTAPDTLETLVYQTLGERSLLMEAIQLWFEPCLLIGELIPQLYPDNPEPYKQTEKILTKLASDWLECRPDLPETSQSWCLKHLALNEPDTVPRALRHWGPGKFRTMPLFIEAAQLIVNFEEKSALLDCTPVNPELLLALSEFHMLTPDVAATIWIIERFRGWYPMIGWLKGNLIDEDWSKPPSEYLQHLIFQLSEQQTNEAHSAMDLLCEASRDSYTDYLCERRTLQRQNGQELAYQPLTLEMLLAIKCDGPPRTGADLLAFILEQLEDVQRRIKNDELSSWKLFYMDDGETPQLEGRCRDRLIGMFEHATAGIRFDPERHVVDQKRVDIMCETMGITLPIEIKRAWNGQLWNAADQQLDDGYVSFHSGSGLGIYLVLWFGEHSKKPRRPADGSPPPSSPEQLKMMLVERSKAATQGRVAVVVLNMTRSQSAK